MPFLHPVDDDGTFQPSAMASPKLPPLQTSDNILNGSAIAPSPANISSSPEQVKTEPTSAESPRGAQSSSGLQVPAGSHTRSSSARHTHPPPSAISNTSSRPCVPPLVHRHTLEVPRASTTSRTSQDHSSPTSDLPNGKAATSPTTPKDRRRTSLTLARRLTASLHSDQFLADVPQDEDASRWAEQIRQRRANRRRRKDEEDDDRVVVGTKVDQHHVNYVTAYNMLTGIRFTVSRTNAKIRTGDITDQHFAAAHKFSFDVYVVVLRMIEERLTFTGQYWQRAYTVCKVRLQIQGLCTGGLSGTSKHLPPRSRRLLDVSH